MNTQEVANRLVELCRQGNYEQAQNELYCENACSIEPKGAPNERVEGIEAIRQKGKQWEASVEQVHSAEVSEPIVAGNHFSLSMRNEITFKGMGRMKIEEICNYKVKDGKIIEEQFFYDMGA